MIILHCTQKAQKKLKVQIQTDLPETGSKLGNWYCNEFIYNRGKYLLFCNENSLLPIVIATKGVKSTEEILEMFRQRYFKIMLNWQIPQNVIENELTQINNIVFAKTQSKSVLGSMNDYVHCIKSMCEYRGISPDGGDCFIQLAGMPMGSMKYNNPHEKTLEILLNSEE